MAVESQRLGNLKIKLKEISEKVESKNKKEWEIEKRRKLKTIQHLNNKSFRKEG